MGVMELLERFVVAVEVIAEASKIDGRLSVRYVTKTEKPEIVNAAFAGEPKNEQAPPETVEQQAKKDSETLNRELIKKELRERGIDFKPGALTTTLAKLLEGARKVGVGPVDKTTAITGPAKGNAAFDSTKAPSEAPAVTKDQVREALANLSGKKGLGEAMDVLKVQGKATKLSEVDPSRYMLILDTCRVRMGVAANA